MKLKLEYSILFIEDSPSDRRLYTRYLSNQSRLKIRVFEATTATQGVKVAAEIKPDVFLLDYRLPDTDGIKIVPELQKVTQAPLILVTSQADPTTHLVAYQKGIVKYLSKDFLSSESLISAIIEALALDDAP